MQLRVARLCLDCEELFVADSCPRCASVRYAFLTTWLPVDERRRWRRPPPRTAAAPERVRALLRAIVRWLGVDEPAFLLPSSEQKAGPRTRASDVVPSFDFGDADKKPEASPSLDPRPAKIDR